MSNIHYLPFTPYPGLSSKHLQMIAAAYAPSGKPPPSARMLVDLGQGDSLSCEISIPLRWKGGDKTIALIHGLGGSHCSGYMIRMARKLNSDGYKVVRINLRGCGSGLGLSKRPYSAGNSLDILKVLQALRRQAPFSDIILIGFSLGGNIALKLAGEYAEESDSLLRGVIAVCPPIDLQQSVYAIESKENYLYHRYYLSKIFRQARPWIDQGKQKISSLYDFDDKITGPRWGYKGASDYYHQCSSRHFMGSIKKKCHLLFAEDDPFIAIEDLKKLAVPSCVTIFATRHGSHMGFLGSTPLALKTQKEFYALDSILMNWIAYI